MRAIRNLFFFTALWASPCSSQTSLSHVKVKYDASEDVSCSKDSIKEEWKAELLSREPEFISLWEAEGPRLLGATESLSGKDFPSLEITARLTLCNVPSESFPETGRVTINMRYALRSFTPEPVSAQVNVTVALVLFHPLAFGGGLIAVVMTGGVVSVLPVRMMSSTSSEFTGVRSRTTI